MTAAPAIKGPAVFEAGPLSPNPYLNIDVVSSISGRFYRNLEKSRLGRHFPIVHWSISRQATCIMIESSTSLALRLSLFRHLSTPNEYLKALKPNYSPPHSQTSFLTTLKVSGSQLILRPCRFLGHLMLCHDTRARPCMSQR